MYSMLFMLRTSFFLPSWTKVCNSSRRASPSAPSTMRPSSASTDVPFTSRFVILMVYCFLPASAPPVHRRQKPCRVVLRLSKPDEKGLATSPAPAASLPVQVSSASPWSCRGGHGTRRRSRSLRPQGLRSHIHLDLLGLCFLALRDA